MYGHLVQIQNKIINISHVQRIMVMLIQKMMPSFFLQ